MKNFSLLILVLSILSCENPTQKFRYRIEKDSIHTVSRSRYPMSAKKDSVTVGGVWFTDHYHMIKDTIAYTNSDGTVVKIAPPFRLFDRNVNKSSH
jgi:hypothetical protein